MLHPLLSSLLLLLLSMVVMANGGGTSCLDEEGRPVDMWIMYKLPAIHWQYAPHVVEVGKGYVYLDNNTEFRFGNNSIGNQVSYIP